MAREPYLPQAARVLPRARVDCFRVADLRVFERPDAFSLPGVLIILRTAATRWELRPRISPISSGVGTGLPITWAGMDLV